MKNNFQPTEQAYDELRSAYAWFNKQLFSSELPSCLITMQRNKRTMGYFSQERFVHHSGLKTDEIAMNPEYFAVQSIQDVLSTLAHEMVHLWQHHFGKPGRAKYHNKEWAAKMVTIGLQPSHTGQPGGRSLGDEMDHYVVPAGQFALSCQALLETNFRISWYDRYPVRLPGVLAALGSSGFNQGGQQGPETESEATGNGGQEEAPYASNKALDLLLRPENTSNRQKFKCTGCTAQAWGKPSLRLICGDCALNFIAT